MIKLKLDADQLRVESFSVAAGGQALRGTVQARSFVSDMVPTGCCGGDKSMYCVETDYAWETCGASCQFQCLPTGSQATCAAC